MAELPRYQETGRIYSDLPSFDFANVRESMKFSQSISNSLDRLSNFATKVAAKDAERKAEEFAIDNPITLEQLKEAEKTGLTANDLIKATGGGTIWQETLKKFQAAQLRTQLEVSANTAALDISNQVKMGMISDPAEITAKFEALQNGMVKPLQSLDPETAMKFQASSGALIKNLHKQSLDKIYDNYVVDKKVETGNYVNVALESVNAIFQTEKDPKVVESRLMLTRRTLADLAKEGGPEFAYSTISQFDKDIENKKASYFESIALKPDYAINTVTGLPDISLAMKKLSDGDLGMDSELWKSYDQDKKDKVIQSVYTRLTQNYSARVTQDKAEKDAKEKINAQTLIDVVTPGRVKWADRLVIAEKLVQDETITIDKYEELIDPSPKKKELTPKQSYLKNKAEYEIRTGRITTFKEVMTQYGKSLPIDAIGELYKPLASEDAKSADKFRAKFSGADYDPYHLQPTTQRKFIQITEATDKKLKEVNKDGTPIYATELEASKAAATEIEESRAEKSNMIAQRRKYDGLSAFGFNPDNGGIDDWGKAKYGANYKNNKSYQTILTDYNAYISYKQKNGNKSYSQLPSLEDLKKE
jgi:hypothetical protein